MPLTNGLGGGQMFAATETNFEADLFDGMGKQTCEIRRGRRRAIKRKPRQQRLHESRLMRAQRMALAPAKERAVARPVVGS